MITKEKIRNTVVGLCSVLFCIVLFVCRDKVLNGVSRGLFICSDVLIPSLFPFMVLSAFCVSYGFAFSGIKPFAFLCRKIIKIPCECMTAVLFGFVGGYPVGASVVSSLYERGIADGKTAKRLMSFCINAGPAFVVTATGTVILGSALAGVLLFVSVCLASVMSGICFSFIYKGNVIQDSMTIRKSPLSDSLIGAVSDSCRNMMIMCGWVVLFCAFSDIVSDVMPEKAGSLFRIFAEVTSGVEIAAETGGLPLVAACISSGGLCVMCQILPAIKKCGIKVYEYLLFRIVNSVFSFIITKIILCFVEIPVSAASFETGFRSKSAVSVVALLVMCAVFIADVSSQKTSDMTFADITG